MLLTNSRLNKMPSYQPDISLPDLGSLNLSGTKSKRRNNQNRYRPRQGRNFRKVHPLNVNLPIWVSVNDREIRTVYSLCDTFVKNKIGQTFITTYSSAPSYSLDDAEGCLPTFTRKGNFQYRSTDKIVVISADDASHFTHKYRNVLPHFLFETLHYDLCMDSLSFEIDSDDENDSACEKGVGWDTSGDFGTEFDI